MNEENTSVSGQLPETILEKSSTDNKGVKRKVLSGEEFEDKPTTPKRKKGGAGSSSDEGSGGSLNTPCYSTPSSVQKTPVSGAAGTPKTPGFPRKGPLSERQQLALFKKISAEEEESAPKVASPPPSTPGSTVKKTPADKKVNKRNERGETPLHLAAIKGDLKQCKRLIKAGGDVNVKDFAGWSPLHEACNHGWVVIAKHFLRTGADVNAQGLDNDTPLHDAAINGHEKLVKLLIRHGANPYQANLGGKTPLDVAANPDIVRLLKGEHTTTSGSDSYSDGQSPTSPESNASEKHEDSHTLADFHGVSSPGSGGDMSSKSGDLMSSARSSTNPKTVGSPRLTLKFQTQDRTKTRHNEQGYKSYSVTMETRENELRFSPFSSLGSESDLAIDIGTESEERLRLQKQVEESSKQDTVDSTTTSQIPKDTCSGSVEDPVSSSVETIGVTGQKSLTDISGSIIPKWNNISGVDSSNITTDTSSEIPPMERHSPAQGVVTQSINKVDSKTETSVSTISDIINVDSMDNLPVNFSKDLMDGGMVDEDGNETPKVPPLRIILPPRSQQSDLPYVVNPSTTSSVTSRASSRGSTELSEGDAKKDSNKVEEGSVGSGGTQDKKDDKEEMPRRTLRSHTQAQQQAQQHGQPSSETNGTHLDSNSNVNHAHPEEDMNMHPKRRKHLRTEAREKEAASRPPPPMPYHPAPERVTNQLEIYLNMKRQIAQKWENISNVKPNPPSGFHEYLLNSGNYVIEGNAASRLSVPMLSPPQSVTGPIRDLFIDQEKERYKLRLRHVIEREKLILSFEQENIRLHGRAARASANQLIPLSVCTVLRDQEMFNAYNLEQEDKNSRSRYNGRQFNSWLQDLDDKYEKMKEALLSRQHHEAESLYAVQKMVWEWKMKDVGLCDPKTTPKIENLWVPMVQVSNEFDLLQS